jgi:hypothetical protein
MLFQICLWATLALIAAAVVALNVWDRTQRKFMSAVERRKSDDKLTSDLREW